MIAVSRAETILTMKRRPRRTMVFRSTPSDESAVDDDVAPHSAPVLAGEHVVWVRNRLCHSADFPQPPKGIVRAPLPKRRCHRPRKKLIRRVQKRANDPSRPNQSRGDYRKRRACKTNSRRQKQRLQPVIARVQRALSAPRISTSQSGVGHHFG